MQTVRQTPEYSRNKIHPNKFTLWVGIASIVMMFAAFTSALIVRRAAGNWYEFRLPNLFFVNTLVLILSSVTLHWSYTAFRKGNERIYKMMLIVTYVLGLCFVVLQYMGWQQMTAGGATFTVNPSASFVYLISGVHAAHVLGGIGALTAALIYAYALPFKPTARRQLRFELVVQYWHFVDVLWVYLIIFFALNV
jgi:cytochrome c oxidase subunit III